MHLALYDAQPEAKAIAHTHPPHLLALSLRVPPETLLDLPLFEADLMAAELALAADHPPGTPALAEAVAEAVRGGRRAVFMVRHGLVCWGETLRQAVALSEELESLARIRLLALGAGTEPTPGADSAE
jgi:L-fuculose-phosphate aldolase